MQDRLPYPKLIPKANSHQSNFSYQFRALRKRLLATNSGGGNQNVCIASIITRVNRCICGGSLPVNRSRKHSARPPGLSMMVNRITGRLSEAGADSVVLGCTDIPPALSDMNLPIPVFNTLEILAKAAVREAIQKTQQPHAGKYLPGKRKKERQSSRMSLNG